MHKQYYFVDVDQTKPGRGRRRRSARERCEVFVHVSHARAKTPVDDDAFALTRARG